MYAYVYVKNKNKYYTLEDSRIDNFSYNDVGIQSKSFAKMPFKCRLTNNAENYEICQILIVQETKEEVQQSVQERRPHVPKLNESDLQVHSDTDNEKNKAKESRKIEKKKKRSAANEICSKIIEAHVDGISESQISHADDEIPSPIVATRTEHANKAVRNDICNSTLLDPNEFDNEMLRANISAIHNMEEVQNSQNETLEIQLKEEKEKTRKLAKVNRLLQEKCISLKEKLDSTSNTNTDSEQNFGKKYPEPINTKSGVQARCDALHEAYSKDEPTTFYINMCYATWGYEDLAKRCIKKTRKSPADYKVLTPKKKRTIKAHLAHFMDFYKYPDAIQQKHYKKLNTYAHRAIVRSRNRMKLIEEYPQLKDDEDQDIEMVSI